MYSHMNICEINIYVCVCVYIYIYLPTQTGKNPKPSQSLDNCILACFPWGQRPAGPNKANFTPPKRGPDGGGGVWLQEIH